MIYWSLYQNYLENQKNYNDEYDILNEFIKNIYYIKIIKNLHMYNNKFINDIEEEGFYTKIKENTNFIELLIMR